MKALYIVYYEGDEYCGEVEGMFNAKGELLGWWSTNDACWRNEYFSPFMLTQGLKVKSSLDRHLINILRKVAVQ